MNKRLIGRLAIALGCVLGPATQAQDFPSRAVRVVVPYAAGGGVDLRARLIAQKMSELLGQPVVVENRPGGGTLVGTRAVLQAPPDGYTILMQSSTLVLAPITYKAPGYRVEDFALVAPIGSIPYMLGVHPSVPARNLAELVAHARANPGKLNNGSLGGGGLVHLLTERFKAAAGIDIVDVAYGGSAAALKDLAGGSIQLYMDGPTLTIPLYKSGQVRILGVSSLRRLPEAPDVPTFREQGFPTITAGNWIALFASAKTPPAVLSRLQRDAASAMTAPDVRDKIAAGYELWTGTREEFGAFMEQDRSAWEKDLRRLNLPLQDG